MNANPMTANPMNANPTTANLMPPGANITLLHGHRGVQHAIVGVRWNSPDAGLAENLRLAAILCGPDGRATGAEDFVFFNQVVAAEESVALAEQFLADDAEQLDIDLPRVPDAVTQIVVVLFINEGSPLRRSLGQLRAAAVRVLDGASGRVVAESVNLADQFSSETAVLLGEVYRHMGDWRFRVVGRGYSTGLVGVAEQFGLPL
jgi:tellurium resistance protein TerD